MITWIAVPGQRIHAADHATRTTQRDRSRAVITWISGALADPAAKVAADAEKMLADARRAPHRAGNNRQQPDPVAGPEQDTGHSFRR